MTVKKIERIADIKIRGGDVSVNSYDDSSVAVFISIPVAPVSLHLTIEEARSIAQALDTVIAAYDASIDRYSEEKDDCAPIIEGS